MAQAPELPDPLTDADFLWQGHPPAAQVALGRMLFFDPILSGNRNISCGTCHDPARGTGDGLALGLGEGATGMGEARRTADPVTGRVPRNAQPLYNLGALEYRSMFHDGRAEPDAAGTFPSGFWTPAREQLPSGLGSLLAAQAMFPVLSPIEMAGQRGENPVADAVSEDRLGDAWSLIASRLRNSAEYVRMFRAAFPELRGQGDITFVHAANAIAAFETEAFRSDDSPFDRFLAGDEAALDVTQKAGLELFYGRAGCAACHSGPLLTDHDFHAIAMPQTGPGKGHGADTSYWRASGFIDRLEDEGRFRVSFETEDLFRFRTPSLRNVALTGPWGHSGAYGSLEAVVRHHADPLAALGSYDPADVALPRVDHLIERTAKGAALVYQPVNPARRDAHALRDDWVMRSPDLRGRIADAATLEPVPLSDADIAQLVAFLDALTSPDAVNPTGVVPASVPSGLPPQPPP